MVWHASQGSPPTNPRSPPSHRCAWALAGPAQESHARQNRVRLRNFRSRREEARHGLQDAGAMQPVLHQGGPPARWLVWKAQGLDARRWLEEECQPVLALASVMIAAQQGSVEEPAEIPTQLQRVMTRRTTPQRHRLRHNPFWSTLQQPAKAKHCRGLWKQQKCRDHEVVEVRELNPNHLNSKRPKRM